MILLDVGPQIVQRGVQCQLHILTVGDYVLPLCQRVLPALREHHLQHLHCLLLAGLVLLQVLVQRHLELRIGQQPLLAIGAEVGQKYRVDTGVIVTNRLGTARTDHCCLSLGEQVGDRIIVKLYILRAQLCIRDKPLHPRESARPNGIIQACHLLIQGVLIAVPPDLSFQRGQLRNGPALQQLHAGVIIGKVRGKAPDALRFKGLAGRHKALVVRGHGNLVPLKQRSVRHQAVHLAAQRKPLDFALRIGKALQIGAVNSPRLLGGGQVHQIPMQIRRVVQGEPAAGDDVRQRAVFAQEFIKVQVVVAYNKLDIHIGKLGLDVLGVAVIQLGAPQVNRNRLCLLYAPCAAARQCGQHQHRCQQNQPCSRRFFHTDSPFARGDHIFISFPMDSPKTTFRFV